MNKEQAKQLIKETFESAFNKEQFVNFIKNFLNEIDESKAFSARGYVKEYFKQVANVIKTYERIATYTDPAENKIDILIVYLERNESLERARTTLRNFVARYLKDRGEKDAALVAFVTPDKKDWRFSLIKMEYNFEETASGKVNVSEKFTPAKRWSFLVGEDEKSHTAQSRLVDILAEDENNPTLAEIEERFSIEPVTKEFFEKYRNLFIRTVEKLDKIVENNENVRKEFEAKNINTVDFAKKLLGQIVFLYFLQKKGWFGVERDGDWGTGPRDFLRRLFSKEYGDYNNFFNDILEPLFYEALAKERDDNFYSRFNCKIPFLNGGLFEPIGNYDWIHTDIKLPNEIFSNNNETPEGDIGDGILDVFDRFNFTVKEDEPLEKEVAIDPELLGKLYEKFNAIRQDNFYEYKEALTSGKKHLEKKFNKKFGVYYTPREIVHYMCQQSLIYYLHTSINQELKQKPIEPESQLKFDGSATDEQLRINTNEEEMISKEDIERFIKEGEDFIENDKLLITKEVSLDSSKYKTPENIRKNAKFIDEKLRDIKVCDPAVGSGAFLVGMMSEIVKVRNVLSVFINEENRTVYNFKRECIENSLYGVDIDSGACEITKLRLWLSLVVDEEDFKQIKPLPNLDYKIMQGNSLISEFLGIDFDVEEEQEGTFNFKDEVDKLIEEFKEKKKEFLNEINKKRKEKLHQEIDDLIIKIFEEKLKKQKSDYFSQLKAIEEKYSQLPDKEEREKLIKEEKAKLYKKTGFNLEEAEKQLKEYTSGRETRQFFPWKLYFAEVFYHNGGFDIVIANPPYGANIDKMVKIYRRIYNEVTKNYTDIYKIFFAKGLNICRSYGVLVFITSNTFLSQPRYYDLRKFLLTRYKIVSIINLGFNVFEDVEVPVAISIIINIGDKNNFAFYDLSVNSKFCGNFQKVNTIYQMRSQKEILKLQDLNILESCSLKKNQKRLEEILWVKDAGIQYHRHGIGLKNKGGSDLYDRLFSKKINHFKNFIPVWYGRLIDFYYIQKETDEFFNLDYKKVLKYNESVSFSKEAFEQKEKILWRQTASYIRASLDRKKRWFRNTIQCAWIKEKYRKSLNIKYILGLMNSKYLRWLYNRFVNENGRLFPQVKITHVKKLPIPFVSLEKQQPIIKLVDKILSLTQSEDYLDNPKKQAKVKEYEKEIDRLVYKLYGLTEEEIKIVENSVK